MVTLLSDHVLKTRDGNVIKIKVLHFNKTCSPVKDVIIYFQCKDPKINFINVMIIMDTFLIHKCRFSLFIHDFTSSQLISLTK